MCWQYLLTIEHFAKTVLFLADFHFVQDQANLVKQKGSFAFH